MRERCPAGVHPSAETSKLGTGYGWLDCCIQQDGTIVDFYWRAKRKGDKLESNPPRNSWLRLIKTMSGGVGPKASASIEWIDFRMPEKTHTGSCRAAASSNSAGAR